MAHSDDDPIIEYFDQELKRRDQQLKAAYQNRALLEFTHGADWFVKHVNAIFLDYGIPGASCYRSGLTELDDYFNNTVTNVDWFRGCWEVDNNYIRDD